MGVLCLCFLTETKGQECAPPNPGSENKKYLLISFCIETQFPVQHFVSLAYSIGSSRTPFGMSLFIQGGYSAYLNQSIDFIVDKKEDANTYLKKNLQPFPGIGAGAELFYNHWNIEFLYQNTGYKISNKNARELVENLLPESESYIAQDMSTFSKIFPMFGNVYNNYKLTSQIRLQQIAGNIGYKFLFWKNNRFGGEFKLGALTIFESSLETKTDQSNEAADYLINLINNSLDDEIRKSTQWLVVPTVSFGVFVRL